MKRIALLVLFGAGLAMGQTPAEPEAAETPAAWTFYTPREFFRLFGQQQPGAERLALCNLSAEMILARAEWRGTAGKVDVIEGWLGAGACVIRELAEGDEPVAGQIRTTWREMGPWREYRPGVR